jgi:hypothetical protein
MLKCQPHLRLAYYPVQLANYFCSLNRAKLIGTGINYIMVEWCDIGVFPSTWFAPTSLVMFSSGVFIVPFCIVLVVAHLRKKSPKRQRLPPGPSPTPVLGNIFGIDTHHPWKTYSKWGEEYGSSLHGTRSGSD